MSFAFTHSSSYKILTLSIPLDAVRYYFHFDLITLIESAKYI